MNLKAGFLNLGRVVHDAMYVLLDSCPVGEKLKTLSQLARIGLLPSFRRGTAVVGKKSFRVRYLDPAGFWQAYHEIFMRQVYFFRSDGEAPVIIDCGANLGLATLYFRTLYPRSIVEAFEPDPVTFKILEENIRQNGLDGIKLHQCALWDSEGELDFYVDKDTPGQLSMSVLDDRRQGLATKIKVPAVRLSQFLNGKAIDFLKIDVEGSEERLLCDLAREGSLRKIRQLAIEYHHPAGGEQSRLSGVLTMLEKEGFGCEVYADFRPRAFRDPLHDVMIYARREA